MVIVIEHDGLTTIVSMQMRSEEHSLYQYKRMIYNWVFVVSIQTSGDVVESVGDEGGRRSQGSLYY